MNIVPKDEKLNLLTARELEVLQYKCEGYSEKEIAHQLVIEPRTVKNHLARIYTKLEIDTFSRSQRAILLPEFRPYIADAIEAKRKQRSDRQKTSDSEETWQTAIVVSSESEQSEWDTENLPPTAIIAVLEDELYLAQQRVLSLQTIAPTVIEIPEDDVRYYNASRKKRRQFVFVIGLTLVAGIMLGAGFTSLWLNQQGENQKINVVPTTVFPADQNTFAPGPTSSSTITATMPVTFPKIVYCGETGVTPASSWGDFLSSQGVSAFGVENTAGAVLNNFVRTLAVDERGLWIGYATTPQNPRGGIGLYTSQDWINCNHIGGVTDQKINDIKIDKTNNLWVATDGAGISVLDGSQWHTYTTADGLPSNAIFGLALDNNDIIWAATLEGVATFDGKTWKVPYSASNDRLVTNKVHALAFDSIGNIWVGHIEAGISQYDNASGQWIYHTVETEELGGNQIRDIVVRKADGDTPESVWFATADGGITKFEQGTWTIYRVEEGLPSNTVIGLAIDKYQRIWAATSAGVSYLEEGRWILYNTINTLDIAFGIPCQNCPIDDDHIWTATSENGLTHSRLPHLSNDNVITVEEICFELIMQSKETCVELETTVSHNTAVISATYPVPLAPGDKLRLKATISPHAPYQLRHDRGDFLANMDASEENRFGASPKIPVEGTIEPGQPYTFVENHYPFVAPQIANSEQNQVFISTWRIWMHTRYVGPLLRIIFTVQKH